MGKRSGTAIRDELMRRTCDAVRARLGAHGASSARPRVSPLRGLAFSPEMVCALRDGTKTQTRRGGQSPASRFAAPGEMMYVRERVHVQPTDAGDRYTYAADLDPRVSGIRFRPAIYMPRAAARFAIRVLELRQERLQSISVADAIAEGCPSDRHTDAVEWYRVVWDTLARVPGTRWCDDPIVWVIRFEVLPMPGQPSKPVASQVPRRGERGATSRRSKR